MFETIEKYIISCSLSHPIALITLMVGVVLHVEYYLDDNRTYKKMVKQAKRTWGFCKECFFCIVHS